MSVAHIQCTSLHEKPAPSCPQRCSPNAACRRVPCTPDMSVTRLKCSSLTPEASAQLPSALQPNVAIAGPSAMHAQQGRDSHQVREPHTRRWRLAVLSVAAQCCYRQVPCALRMSVTHIQCTSLTREAITQLLSAPQPNAAIVSPSAMHAPHERDSHPVHQPHGEAGARLPSALQPNVAVAECHAPASYQKPAPSCSERWPKAAIAAPSAMHAQQGRDSHQVRESHTRSWRLAALSAAAQCCYRRVPCTPRMSMTHIKCASLAREAGARLPSALQPNAAIAECRARLE